MSIAQLDSQLCFALYSASNHLTSIYRPILEKYDLTYPQFVVLMALWEKEHVSISELAKKSGLGKATMTPLLIRLEQKSLIDRAVDPLSERQKVITLTAQGKALSTESGGITHRVFCSTGLTSEEARQMISLCHQMMNHSSGNEVKTT